MPPRAKAAAIRVGGDESEDDLAATRIEGDGGENRKTATKSTKSKKITRRVSAGKPATKRKAAPTRSRQALKDRTNIPDGNETEEVDAFDDADMADTAQPKAKRARTATKTRRTAAKAKENASEEELVMKKAPAKRGRPAKRAPSAEPTRTIPETQPEPELMEDVEQSIEQVQHDMEILREPTPPQKVVHRAPSVTVQPLLPRPSARAGSAQPGYSRARERSGSASAAERRGGDAELRRQLHEMNKKYETLQLKYESLEELGKTQAESNFDKLKRASDQKARDAHELISSLKKELTDLRKSNKTDTSESTALLKQVNALTTANEQIISERDELKSRVHVSQNEIKTLEARLSNARQDISKAAQEAKEAASKKPTAAAAASVADGSKEWRLKEEVYQDLTGLMIMGVKHVEGEDIFKCIQNGRNGTLQFNLSVANSDAQTPHPKTPSGVTYEDAEFAYEPQFDEKNDQALLDILPDYLTEEICFPRGHAQRFYSKVVDSMTKKIVVEDD